MAITKEKYEEIVGKRIRHDILLKYETAAKLTRKYKKGKLKILDVGCFVPGTKITTDDFTQKSIENVKKGEKVLTHKGGFERVIRTFKREYRGEILKIKSGTIEVSATPEHPFLSLKREDIRCLCNDYSWNFQNHVYRPNKTHKKRCSEINNKNLNSKIGFKLASSLNTGDFIAIPVPKSNDKIDSIELGSGGRNTIHREVRSVVISPELLRLLGYYLAEGSILYSHKDRPAGVSFCFNLNETEYINDVANLFGKCNFDVKIRQITRKNKNTTEINVYNRDVGRMFLFLCDKGAKNKCINKMLLSIDPKLQLEIVKGLFRGDGNLYISKKGKRNSNILSLKTVSEKLAQQIFWLLARNNIKSYVSFEKKVNSFGTSNVHIVRILGREINKLNDERFIVNSRQASQCIILDKFILIPIKSIKKIKYSGFVYNLMVNKDNSYVSNHVAVHNCGQGIFAFYADNSWAVTGIDMDKDRVKRANRIERKNTQFCLKSAENFKFKDKFDVVLALDIIEHLDHPQKALDSIHSALKDDGVLIVSNPNRYSFWNILNNIAHLEDHKNYWRPGQFGEMARKSGFEMVEVLPRPMLSEGIGWAMDDYRDFQKTDIKLGKTLPFFATGWFLVFKKK
jgi:SAM-dependent methyltransferase